MARRALQRPPIQRDRLLHVHGRGLTWSEPIQINQTPTDIDPGDQQAFLPTIQVAAAGTVGVTYYDFRFNDPQPGLPTDYWFVYAHPDDPGGLTNPANWAHELRLTNKSFDLEKAPNPRGYFVGDYEGLAAAGDSFLALFTQPHRRDPDNIFFRRIDERHHRTNGGDDGNTRRASAPNADSRGQVWTLDEQTMTATLAVNADLGNYSGALGAAQRLSNGNFFFTSGRQGDPPNTFGQSIEVRPDGTTAYVLEINRSEYRSFRMRTLYQGISDLRDDSDGTSPAAGHHGSLGDASSAAAVNFNNDSVLDPGVFMELTGLVQPTGIATLAFSPPGFAEGSLLAPFRNTAAVEGPLGNQSMRPLAARLPTSSSRVQQLVPERISVDCAGDWFTDRLIDDLPAVATAASDSWFADLGNDLWHDGHGTDLAG